MRLNDIVLLKLGLLQAKSRELSRCHGVYFAAFYVKLGHFGTFIFFCLLLAPGPLKVPVFVHLKPPLSVV